MPLASVQGFLQGFLKLLHGRFDSRPSVAGDLVAKFVELLLGAEHRLVGLIADLDLLLALAIGRGVILCLALHPIDLSLRQAA